MATVYSTCLELDFTTTQICDMVARYVASYKNYYVA